MHIQATATEKAESEGGSGIMPVAKIKKDHSVSACSTSLWSGTAVLQKESRHCIGKTSHGYRIVLSPLCT